MKMKGTLPKGESNGISALEPKILKKSHPIVALVVLDEAGRYQDHETLEWEVTLKIRRIEAVLAEDIEAATRLVQRAYESRTGDATLPIELEEEIRDALKGVSLYQPETEQAEEQAPAGPPDGGYETLKVPELLALLKRRGLDHSKGTKTELLGRLQTADLAAESGDVERPANVTSIFADGSDYVPPTDEEVEAAAAGLTDDEIDHRAQAAMDRDWEDADPANADEESDGS